MSSATHRRTVRALKLALLACLSAAILLMANGNVCRRTPLQARESVLKQDLATMRTAIDNYTLDKKQAPRSIQDLVDAHYLRAVPVDPVCRQEWTLHFGDTLVSPGQTGTGIDDVHSSCEGYGASDPTPYNTW